MSAVRTRHSALRHTQQINFLKKFVSSTEFKKKYDKSLYMVNIKSDSNSTRDEYIISITKHTNEIDSNLDNVDNDWYNELLHLGKKYINRKYKPWKDVVWDSVDIDDEYGTIEIYQ